MKNYANRQSQDSYHILFVDYATIRMVHIL